MANRRDGSRQVAALPLRQDASGAAEVLLITSRDTRRWVIPKGWPMDGLADWDAAAQEALEEAGLVGQVGREPLGEYAYFKRREGHFDLLDVTAYPLWVSGRAPSWREEGQRDEWWLPPVEAAVVVQEPGLKAILLRLNLTAPAKGLAS